MPLKPKSIAAFAIRMFRISVLSLFIVITPFLYAQNKSLDLRDQNQWKERISLNGNWAFYPNELVDPAGRKSLAKQLNFPSTWKEYDFATYQIQLLIPSNLRSEKLAIDVPPMFSSYALFVNGELIGENGKVGATKEKTQPEWRPAIYIIENHSDTLTLTLQIANFYNSRGGGLKSIYIGTADVVNHHADLIKKTDYALFSCLILLGLILLLMYYIKHSYRNPFLYLSLFVLVWAARSFSSNQYRILEWFDIPWGLLVKLEYMSIYFTMITALLFLSSLFSADFKNKYFKIGFISLCLFFAAFTLITDPIIFTRYLLFFLSVGIFLIVYLIVVLSNAFVNDRAGSTIMLITLLLGAITFGYVIFAYLGYTETNMLIYNFSFIILFTLLAISMSVRLSKLAGHDESDILTFDQLYKDDTFK